MKVSKAVALNIAKILEDRKISKYKLAKITGLPRATLKSLFNGKYDGVNLKTVMIIIRELNMPAEQFFKSELFHFENLDLD